MESKYKKLGGISTFGLVVFIFSLILSPDFRNCVFLISGVIYLKLIAYPFFSGVMISWGVAVASTFIVLFLAYINHDKREQQYKEIFHQSESWLRRITIVVLFYLSIHLASKAFWGIGIPIFSQSYAELWSGSYNKLDFLEYISPQDVFLSSFVVLIIFFLFVIAPYSIDRYKNIVRTLLIISLALSILTPFCIPSFVPVNESSTEPPQMPESYLFRLNAGLEDDLNKSVISEGLKNSFKTAGFSLSDNATVTKEKENKWVITDEEKFIVRKEDDRYLFSWDNVPGNDSERLLKYLRADIDMGWVENPEINKSDDGKTIYISKDENHVQIMIDEKKKKAILNITNYDLKVKKENGKLNIYEAGKLNVYRGERDPPVYWFCIIFVVFSIVSLLIYKFRGIPEGIKSDFRDILLVFCFVPAIIVASLVLAGDDLVKFPNLFGLVVVGLLLISGFAALMSIVAISFKQETIHFPLFNPVWILSAFASLAAISGFSILFLWLRDFVQLDIFRKVLSFSVAIMILILLYGFLYEKLQKYQFTEWWRRECRPIAMIISIVLIAIVSAINPNPYWLWRWEIPKKLLGIVVVLVIGYFLPWLIMGFRILLNKTIRELCVDFPKLPKYLKKLSKGEPTILPVHQGMVLVKVKTGPDNLKKVVEGLDAIEGVYQTMVVTGEYDVCLTVEGVSSDDIEKKILEIRKIDGIVSTTTLTDIREFFDREVR